MVPDPKVAGLPDAQDGPVFNAPWEASVFAIAVSLSEAGHFTWPEWVERYSAEIAKEEARHKPGETVSYYSAWLRALETIVTDRHILDDHAIERRHVHLRTNPPPHDHDAHREPVCIA